MIPIRDTIPCFSRPLVTWSLMAINISLFIALLFIPDAEQILFLYKYGMVGARYTYPDWGARVGLLDDSYLSFLTSMFLHGGWGHLVMNMLFLWIFADNIEDVMGRFRFIIFYLLCGLLAVLLQYFYNPSSTLPMVGASGAIAGVMGAYFILYPYARIVLWLPLFLLPIFFEVPAVAFLGLWVIFQIYEASTAIMTQEDIYSTVAWWAHLGGFIAGVMLHPFFLKKDYPDKPEP